MPHSCSVYTLFDRSRTRAVAALQGVEYPWQILPRLSEIIQALGDALDSDQFLRPSPGVWVARSARVAGSAFLGAPCIVDEDAEVRHGAFIRGSALVGRGAVVGNSTELKNALLFDGAQAPHYNYVGDSVMGFRAHMGAGAVLSNVRGDHRHVTVHAPEGDIETGLRKLGGILGDEAEIGCNCVIGPGCVIGRGSMIYPLSFVRGVVPAGRLYKDAGHIVPRRVP